MTHLANKVGDIPAPLVDGIACSVVIPTVGRSDLLERVLDALDAQTFADFEVIVVFDGADANAGLAETVAFGYPLIKVQLQDNRGQATARNAGVAAASGRIVAFIDDDMIPEPGFIATLMKHHDPSTVVEPRVVCGRIVEEYASPPASRLEAWLRKRRDSILETALDSIASSELVARAYVCCGASCSLPRTVFMAAGGFREYLRYVHEDADLGLRLMDSGVEFVVERSAVVRHQNRKDMRVSFLEGNTAIAAAHVQLARRHQLAAPHARRLALLSRPSKSGALVTIMARVPSAHHAAERALEKMVELSGNGRFAEAWRSLAGRQAYIEGIEASGEASATAAQLVRSGPPVLVMHAIGDPDKEPARRFSLDPRKLRGLCECLASSGWKGVALSAALAQPENTRQVALTFDDGYEDFLDMAVPILDEFAFKATVYVVSGLIGQFNSWDTARGRKARRLLSAAQIRTLVQHGFELGSHSVTHAWLPKLGLDDLRTELRNSRTMLEDVAGCGVTTVAYPSGGVDVRARFEAGEAGYDSAATAFGGGNVPLDLLAIERWQIDRDHSVGGAIRTVVTGIDHRERRAAGMRRLGSRIARPALRAR